MGKGGDRSQGESPGADISTTNVVAEPTTEIAPAAAAGAKLTDAVVPGDPTASASGSGSGSSRRWWNRGGMHVNEVGMAVNIFVGPLFLLSTGGTTTVQLWTFAAALAFNVSTAYVLHKMRTVFCVIAVPIYMTSVLLVSTLDLGGWSIVKTLALSVALAMARVGVCMSACLHRYAAHAAWKSGPITQLFVSILGCLAHQGGPIWWASQHRAHHKHCDLPRDPHSAVQVGTERAFAFFEAHPTVEEEFAPKHCDNWYLRILDTFSFSMVTLEMAVVAYLFGRQGLFVSYTSIWICQTITLWFNVANHPEDQTGVCKASNRKAKPDCYYPAFLLFDFLYPFFGVVVSEGAHEDHHRHFMLAKRDPTDCTYFAFILPMQVLGLIWDVKVAPPE